MHSYLCSDIGAKRVFKVSAAGEIQWEYPADQCTDAWLLENGNTVVGNWFIHERHTDSTPFFEVTPDKKVVWRVDMHERMFDPASIQILDVKGTPLR